MPTPKDEIAKYATQSQMSAFFIDRMGIINVKSYGAEGDGVTDDSTALQSAINAATTGPYNMIWVPLGTYLNTGLTDTSRITFMTNSTATAFTGSTYSLLQWVDILSSSDLLGSTEYVESINGLFGTPSIAVSTDLSLTKSSASSSLTIAATSNLLVSGANATINALTVSGAINSTVGLATFSTAIVEGGLTIGGNYRTASTGLRLEITSSGEIKQYNASNELHGVHLINGSSNLNAQIDFYRGSTRIGYIFGTSNAMRLINGSSNEFVILGSTAQLQTHQLRGNWKVDDAFGCNGSTGSTNLALSADLSTTLGGSSDLNRTNSIINEIKNLLITFGLASS